MLTISQVKYWALGNEVWGPWQVEQTTAKVYARQAYQWAKALKLLDPSIQLVLCGETGFSSWDHTVLAECLKWSPHQLGGSVSNQLIDMISIHIYTSSDEHVPNVLGKSSERPIMLNTYSCFECTCITDNFFIHSAQSSRTCDSQHHSIDQPLPRSKQNPANHRDTNYLLR